ncbi:MAG: hypothetical protein HY748_16925 [Elusimicrobia bacterium]|nr:hypothetical protein [Elusimicrobiota bacterium]
MRSERIKNWPTKERPRERLIAEGPERLTDADLLAIILRVGLGTFKKGVLGKNARDSALSILKDFRGLRGLDRAHIHDLLMQNNINSEELRGLQIPLPPLAVQKEIMEHVARQAAKKSPASGKPPTSTPKSKP